MLFTTGSKSYFTIYYIHKDFTIECNTEHETLIIKLEFMVSNATFNNISVI